MNSSRLHHRVATLFTAALMVLGLPIASAAAPAGTAESDAALEKLVPHWRSWCPSRYTSPRKPAAPSAFCRPGRLGLGSRARTTMP